MKIWDVSVPLEPGLPVWPGDKPVACERYRSIAAGDASNDSRLSCSVHSGTHVDAPRHFIDNGKAVDELSLEVLMGRAWLAHLPDVAVITAEHLETLAIPADTRRLLLKTRNSQRWSDPHHAFAADFVALDADAARWVVDRGIQLIGIDYLSIQRFDDPTPRTHQTLLAAGVIIVEGLNLASVETGRYHLICLPLKLTGSDGAPARVVLMASDPEDSKP